MSYYIDGQHPTLLRNTENNVVRKVGEIERELIGERDQLAAQARELRRALEGLMRIESRGRIMPIGHEWDAARKATAKADRIESEQEG